MAFHRTGFVLLAVAISGLTGCCLTSKSRHSGCGSHSQCCQSNCGCGCQSQWTYNAPPQVPAGTPAELQMSPDAPPKPTTTQPYEEDVPPPPPPSPVRPDAAANFRDALF